MLDVWLYWIVGLVLSTVFGAILVRKDRVGGYSILVGVYSIFIIIANLLTSRLVRVNLFGWEVITDGATLMFPFIAQVVDMINEVYGRRATYRAIRITLLCSIIATIMVWHVASQPPAITEAGVPEVYEEAWQYYLRPVARIVLASYMAFYLANMVDAKIFSDLKRYFYGKYNEAYRNLRGITMFVLARSIASDVVNMLVDSAVFYPVAFLGLIPIGTFPDLLIHSAILKVFVITITQPYFIAYRLMIKDVERVVD